MNTVTVSAATNDFLFLLFFLEVLLVILALARHLLHKRKKHSIVDVYTLTCFRSVTHVQYRFWAVVASTLTIDEQQTGTPNTTIPAQPITQKSNATSQSVASNKQYTDNSITT